MHFLTILRAAFERARI